MRRMPALSQAQVVHPEVGEQETHLVPPVEMRAMYPPRRHDDSRLPCAFHQNTVVFRTNGVGLGAQHVGVGSAKREQVGHAQTTKAPVAGEADAPADRRIVHPLVRGAGVQPNEQRVGFRGVPKAEQVVAV